MEQYNLFHMGCTPLKFDKPLRLIELFAGYGSQALALKYLGVPFEHHVISEWAVKSIQAYKDMHFGDDDNDYSADMSVEQIKAWFVGRISRDYDNPMTEKEISRMSEKECRLIYNNMKTTNNIGSIVLAKGADLKVTETDRYTYLLTPILAKTFHKPDLERAWRRTAEHAAVCCGK